MMKKMMEMKKKMNEMKKEMANAKKAKTKLASVMKFQSSDASSNAPSTAST